ncbi:MAG: hypothetical protein ACR2MS_10830 [Weeksellaceae bacterium]
MPILKAQTDCAIYSWNALEKNYEFESKQNLPKHYLDSLINMGYLTLSIDSISQNNKCTIYINKGTLFNQYVIENSHNTNKHTHHLEDLEKIKDSLKNAGQLFSKITLKPKGFRNSQSIYNLQIDEDSVRKIDEIKFIGYQKFPKSINNELLNHNHKIHNTFNLEDRVNHIEDNIEELRYIQLTQPSKISYTKDSTILYLYTKRVKSNTFDGVLGFNAVNKKLQLNGNIHLSLNNTLNLWENINLDWTGESGGSQSLDFNANFPYLFLKRIGIQSNIKIRKQDSTFIQFRLNNGINYQVNFNQTIGVHHNFENSTYINSNGLLGDDYTKNGLGIAYTYHRDNYAIFKQNKVYAKFNTSLLYKVQDKENLKQTELGYNIYTQQKIFNNNYAFAKLSGESLFQKDNNYLINELYQLGGINDLRGFNQKSIFSPSYNIITLAYRYIPSNNFQFSIFSDLAHVREISTTKYNFLTSIGGGIQFKTNVGIIKLQYAQSLSNESEININNGKVHIGVLAIF